MPVAEARSGERALNPLERQLAGLSAGAVRVFEVRVFEELLTLSRLNRGRIYPSYDYLAEATALGRATVARALAALEALGLLVRQRRFRRIEAEGPGPRYKQTSNVYRAILPDGLVSYLPRWMRPAPLPADAAWRATDETAQFEAMRASLDCRDFALSVADGALGKALARLGASLDASFSKAARESHDDPQTLPEFSLNHSNMATGTETTVRTSPDFDSDFEEERQRV